MCIMVMDNTIQAASASIVENVSTNLRALLESNHPDANAVGKAFLSHCLDVLKTGSQLLSSSSNKLDGNYWSLLKSEPTSNKAILVVRAIVFSVCSARPRLFIELAQDDGGKDGGGGLKTLPFLFFFLPCLLPDSDLVAAVLQPPDIPFVLVASSVIYYYALELETAVSHIASPLLLSTKWPHPTPTPQTARARLLIPSSPSHYLKSLRQLVLILIKIMTASVETTSTTAAKAPGHDDVVDLDKVVDHGSGGSSSSGNRVATTAASFMEQTSKAIIKPMDPGLWKAIEKASVFKSSLVLPDGFSAAHLVLAWNALRKIIKS